MPDPAARAEHHHRLPWGEVELIVEAAQRGDAIGAQRPRLLGAQPLGNRRDLVLCDRDILGVEPALEAVGIDAIPDAKALRPIAQRDDLSRSVVADDLRERTLPELDLAQSDVRVPDADPRAVEPDQDLVSPGWGTGSVAVWRTSGPPNRSIAAAFISLGIDACMVAPAAPT